jgi:uracil-DNA glycosylase
LPDAGLDELDAVAATARACTVCAAHLPLGPRPILRVSRTARVLIASQAPGTRAHLSGIPFDDASGDRLRAWLAMPPDVFYDAARIAIMPMGMCYPGRLPNGGDAPPRPECAPLWRDRVLPLLTGLRLTLLVGTYSLTHTLGRGTMSEHVRNYAGHLARGIFPLPHPSWRTGAWERRNPWFTDEVIPALRRVVAEALDGAPVNPPPG